MTSVFDHLAKTTAVVRDVTIIGIDPDLHTTGIAIGRAVWKEPCIVPSRVVSITADLIRIPGNLTSVRAADAMAGQLAQALAKYATVIEGEVILIAEAQQLYPDEDMPRNEVVAKGNDFLRLAQVTGAAQALASARGWGQLSVLPATWKKQKSKDVHHGHIGDRLRDGKIPVTIGGKPFGAQGPAYGHAVDAIGMVLWGAVEASAGRLPVYTVSVPAPRS